jgi:hypothetical protein
MLPVPLILLVPFVLGLTPVLMLGSEVVPVFMPALYLSACYLQRLRFQLLCSCRHRHYHRRQLRCQNLLLPRRQQQRRPKK